MARPRTLRGRLALWYAGVLAVILVAYSGVLYLVAVADDEPARAATQSEEQEEVRTTGRRMLVALSLGLPAALLLSVGGGLWLLRRGLAPIEEVVRVAGELGVEQLERRIPLSTGAGEEVVRLVAALNGMLDRLEHSVGGIRRFTADASHELRTPLAVLMGSLEVALRRPRESGELRSAMEGTLEDLGELMRLVESLLTLARADAGELPLQPLWVDAGELARQVLEPFEAIAAERGIRLSALAPETGAQVRTDPLWLGRALANLVDNACKFTPAGGEVRVTVTLTPQGDRVRIAVSNTGPGLSADEAARAFERFYRGPSVRGSTEGFGLGLPLARDIVRALHGDLLSAPAPEGGAQFFIDLPVGCPRGRSQELDSAV